MTSGMLVQEVSPLSDGHCLTRTGSAPLLVPGDSLVISPVASAEHSSSSQLLQFAVHASGNER